MTIACALLQQHIQTLVDDNAQWQKLIADDIVWELTYAPSLGHPARLSGREEAVRHATDLWGLWRISVSSTSRYMPLPIPKELSPKSRVKASSRRQGVSISKIMWYSCVLQAARSHSYENISIPYVRPRHLTPRLSVSSDLQKYLGS